MRKYAISKKYRSSHLKSTFTQNTKQMRNEKTTPGINLKRIYEETTAEGHIDFETWP